MSDQTGNQKGSPIVRWAVFSTVLGVLAITLSEGLRVRVLDALFGAEEEFEYEPSLNGSSDASTGSVAAASQAD